MSVTCVPESESAIFPVARKIRHLIDLVKFYETYHTIMDLRNHLPKEILLYEITGGCYSKQSNKLTSLDVLIGYLQPAKRCVLRTANYC